MTSESTQVSETNVPVKQLNPTECKKVINNCKMSLNYDTKNVKNMCQL
jgi:hypothetical protein